MTVSFTENAWEDYLYWQKMDKKIVKRINELFVNSNLIFCSINSPPIIFWNYFSFS